MGPLAKEIRRFSYKFIRIRINSQENQKDTNPNFDSSPKAQTNDPAHALARGLDHGARGPAVLLQRLGPGLDAALRVRRLDRAGRR